MSDHIPNLDNQPPELQNIIFGYLTPEELACVSGTCKNLYFSTSAYAAHQNRVLRRVAEAVTTSTEEFEFTPLPVGTSLKTYHILLPHVCIKLVCFRLVSVQEFDKYKREYETASRLFSIIKDEKRQEVIKHLVRSIWAAYEYFEPDLGIVDFDSLNYHLSKLMIMLLSPILKYNDPIRQYLLYHNNMLYCIFKFYMFGHMSMHNYRDYITLLGECKDGRLKSLMEQMMLKVEQNGYKKEECELLSTVFSMLRRRKLVAYVLWTTSYPRSILLKVTHVLLEKSIGKGYKKAIRNVIRSMHLDLLDIEYLCCTVTLCPIFNRMSIDAQEYFKKYHKKRYKHLKKRHGFIM